jgi:hypothetical protein
VCPAAHLERGTAREGQHEDARRVDAVDNQVRHAMGERVGFAGSGAGDDQQRTGAIPFLGQRLAMSHGLALRCVELVEVRRGRGHERTNVNYTLSYTSTGGAG